MYVNINRLHWSSVTHYYSKISGSLPGKRVFWRGKWSTKVTLWWINKLLRQKRLHWCMYKAAEFLLWEIYLWIFVSLLSADLRWHLVCHFKKGDAEWDCFFEHKLIILNTRTLYHIWDCLWKLTNDFPFNPLNFIKCCNRSKHDEFMLSKTLWILLNLSWLGW